MEQGVTESAVGFNFILILKNSSLNQLCPVYSQDPRIGKMPAALPSGCPSTSCPTGTPVLGWRSSLQVSLPWKSFAWIWKQNQFTPQHGCQLPTGGWTHSYLMECSFGRARANCWHFSCMSAGSRAGLGPAEARQRSSFSSCRAWPVSSSTVSRFSCPAWYTLPELSWKTEINSTFGQNLCSSQKGGLRLQPHLMGEPFNSLQQTLGDREDTIGPI